MTYLLPIGGEWLQTETTDTIRLPYDDSPIAEVPQGNPALVDRAVSAARAAAAILENWTNYQRAELLDRIAALLRRDRTGFANAVSSETGKPITEARAEVDRGLQTLLASSIAARELHGEVVPIDAAPTGAGRLAMTIRQPLGVIGIITPFNFPLNLTLHKLGPALAGGNAVVHKPSEQTPLSALMLARIVQEAGAPAGAYNVVTGPGETVGSALVESPGVDMITFTGSVPVGRAIRARAGLKKVTLELGGNGAVIIEPDADLDAAVPRVVQGGYGYSGQSCISVQRVYVHESIAANFRDRLVAAVEKLNVGHPAEETSQIASLITVQAAERVEQWTRQAAQAGAKILTGGDRTRATIRPGILTEVPEDSRFMREELFGPLVAVNAYRDLDRAIELVNGTSYGLQAGIYTQHLQRAFQAAQKIRAGGVLINDVPTFRADLMPYGGTKESGLGREGPRYAVQEMTEPKLICWHA
ncbi:MAG: Aldehyde Dehydrogenase [Bryobacterales bacterium]|nr:Aldehyde Dehydrogenase [Bryobacterales bacterium]